jgi:hypothetical protein
MWVLGLIPGLIVLALIAGGVALLVRGRGAEGWNIQFPSVLFAYTAIAMLAGVFMAAAGGGLLLKSAFAAGERDFSYNTQRYQVYEQPPLKSGDLPPQPSRTVDPSDNAVRDDIATGISLAFAGTVLFGIHAFGSVLLRGRKPAGEELVTRAYNLIGLAGATFGFLGSGAQALNDLVRRYVVAGDVVEPWQIRHPGEPLGFAVVLLPLIAWFGWRVWQELGGGRAKAVAATAGAVTGFEPAR